MRIRWVAGGILVLLVLAAGYWLLPAYILPPSSITQRPPARIESFVPQPTARSYVFIPLTFSVENIKQMVREQMTGELLRQNFKVPGRNLKLSISRNGKLAIWVYNNHLHVVFPIEFAAEGDLNTDGQLTIFTRASFDVSDNWEPLVHARSTFRWDDDPKVGFWPFRINIASNMAPFVQAALDRGSDDFQQQARNLYNLRSNAEAGWKRLHGPHALDTESQTWLTMVPREVYLEPISGDETDIRVSAWMGGDIGIVQGETLEPTPVTPLPQLKRGTPPAKTTTLAAPITIPYAEMLNSLASALVGQTLPSTSGELTVKALDLYGSGDQLALGLDFEGRRHGTGLPTRGRVYLLGQPRFDAASCVLRVESLAITEASLNPLSHGARWVLQDAPAWAALLEKQMAWNVEPRLEQHRKQLDAHLNRTIPGRFDLWGKVKEIEIAGIHPQAEGVLLDVQALSELELLLVP